MGVDALGGEDTVTSAEQKDILNGLIESTVADNPKYEVVEVVRQINNDLGEMLENNTSDEPVMLDKKDVKAMLMRGGIEEEDLEAVEQKYEDMGDELLLNAEELYENKSFEVKTAGAVVKVKPEDSNIIKIKMIEGRKCLVIPIDDNMEVNGIFAKIKDIVDQDA